MELCKTGRGSLPNEIMRSILDGETFGIRLKLWLEKDEVYKEDLYPFLVKERNPARVVGVVDIGNGQGKQLTFTPSMHGDANTYYSYELSELPEVVDTVHVMD